jgi:hypothetical protein
MSVYTLVSHMDVLFEFFYVVCAGNERTASSIPRVLLISWHTHVAEVGAQWVSVDFSALLDVLQ